MEPGFLSQLLGCDLLHLSGPPCCVLWYEEEKGHQNPSSAWQTCLPKNGRQKQNLISPRMTNLHFPALFGGHDGDLCCPNQMPLVSGEPSEGYALSYLGLYFSNASHRVQGPQEWQ